MTKTMKSFRLSPMTIDQLQQLQTMGKTSGWTETQIIEYAINHIAGHAIVDALGDDVDQTRGHAAVDA